MQGKLSDFSDSIFMDGKILIELEIEKESN